MTLSRFAHEYDQLPPGEQALFAEAVRRLLTDGLIWRDDDDDRRIYNYLGRRGELVLTALRERVHVEPYRNYAARLYGNGSTSTNRA
jgi:hypothetical protein